MDEAKIKDKSAANDKIFPCFIRWNLNQTPGATQFRETHDIPIFPTIGELVTKSENTQADFYGQGRRLCLIEL